MHKRQRVWDTQPRFICYNMVMSELYPFFIVVFSAVFFSTIFRRFNVPWVIALIIGGMVIGPFGFDLLPFDGAISVISQIGLVFLMFMAGLETRLSGFRDSGREIASISLLNGVIPFSIGVSIGYFFGYDLLASLLLGIIFISSSIAVIIPSLETNKLLHTRLGRSIVASTIIEDVASLVLLSVLLQTINPVTAVPLPLFYVLLVTSILFLRWVLPKIQWLFSFGSYSSHDLFQQELRSMFTLLIGTVIIFELLGLHAIIAGFFAGLVFSGAIKSELMKEKLRTISYGLFIPTFFIVIGTKTDIGVLVQAGDVLILTAVIVVGSVLSKFASGWAGGKLNGFSGVESSLIGASTIPQLSTTLAVVFTGIELGILKPELATAMVTLSIVTVFISPIVIRILGKKIVVPA